MRSVLVCAVVGALAVTACRARVEPRPRAAAVEVPVAASEARQRPRVAVEPAVRSDDAVGEAVEWRLRRGQDAGRLRVEARANEGVVTLLGTADNLLVKQRAERRAESIRGVREVRNRIQVAPTDRTDAEVASDVRSALLAGPATDHLDIEVIVEGGTARLTGTVPSSAESALAEQVTRGIRGVLEIENDLAVSSAEQRAAAEVRADVLQRLTYDVRFDDERIEARVEQATVVLEGTVDSARERRLAAQAARVVGARDVDVTGLGVRPSARDFARRSERPQPPDEAIEAALEAALARDPRVRRAAIEVVVEQGVATLSGRAPTLLALRAAEQDASSTWGIRRVNNRLLVRPLRPADDSLLAERLRAAFQADAYLHEADVQVGVHDGVALLTGTVDGAAARRRAEELAARQSGLTRVDDRLRVEGSSDLATDRRLERDVRRALSDAAGIDAEAVDVVVLGGVVTLRGRVDPRTLAGAAEVASDLAPGQLQNQLELENSSEIPATAP